MMKKSIILGYLLTNLLYKSQVGINTQSPKVTLDVIGKPHDPSTLDGIIAPRISGFLLGLKDYTKEERGALIYVTSPDLQPFGQTIHVTSTGYYYFNGNIWEKLISGPFEGDNSNDAFINSPTTRSVKLDQKSDGSIRSINTNFIITDDGNVIIGSAEQNKNSALQINTPTKGLLPPRVKLSASDLPLPLSEHIQGMVVFNTNTAGVAPTNVTPGLYINNGDSWKQLSSSIQKYESFFGEVNYGDINANNGAQTSLETSGFIISAVKKGVSGGDNLVIQHGLNLNGKQNITVTILSNTIGESNTNFNQYNKDNDWFQPVIHDINSNSFSVYIEENHGTVQDVRMMIQLTNY